MSDEKWAFTFSFSDEERRSRYVVFTGTYKEARTKMFKKFDRHWAMQYPWDEFQEQITEYCLTLIELEATEDE